VVKVTKAIKEASLLDFRSSAQQATGDEPRADMFETGFGYNRFMQPFHQPAAISAALIASAARAAAASAA